ncbi:MAG: hypothetical protein HC933_09620 [Pleurocapsa sp. SU_196_0]|nr:hypothetical protein [Pleurocapsa sp. SU_196_0]
MCPRSPVHAPTTTDPPTVAITQPASDATLTGATTIHIDAQDRGTGIAKVSLYARGRDSNIKGVLIGTAVSKPYVISWQPNTALGVPNATELELVAVARDFAGNEDISSVVKVKPQNPSAPSLHLLTAFTFPPEVKLSTSTSSPRTSSSVFDLEVRDIQPPKQVAGQQPAPARVATLDVATRVFALEWDWFPTPGVDGYCIYGSHQDIAGVYKQQACQNASSGAAKEKFSVNIPDAGVGTKFWGAVTTVSGNRTVESGKSNAHEAQFLPAQDSATPADGSSVTDGKPNLTWTPTNGATAYLFYVFDRNPWETGAVLKGTNFPFSTASTSSTWADGEGRALPALSSGTYYWWVSGVSFNADGRANALSFSDPKRFVVP